MIKFHNMTALITLFVPFPNQSEALALAEILLRKKLISCSNILRADSLYIWEKKIQKDEEYIAIFKSLDSQKEALVTFIEKNHSYEVPCIITETKEVNKKYYDWMKTQIDL